MYLSLVETVFNTVPIKLSTIISVRQLKFLPSAKSFIFWLKIEHRHQFHLFPSKPRPVGRRNLSASKRSASRQSLSSPQARALSKPISCQQIRQKNVATCPYRAKNGTINHYVFIQNFRYRYLITRTPYKIT